LPFKLLCAGVLVFLPVHFSPVCAEDVRLEDFILCSGSDRRQQESTAGEVDMKCQRWALTLVLGLLLSGVPIAVAQVDQNAPQVLKVPQTNHAGGKDDIQAIGNRKIGGSGLGNWYSLEHEISIGRDYSREIEGSVKLIQDPVVTEYVNRIGQNLVRNSDAKVPFTIKVIDSEEVNAFALPGGFLYVNSGLIRAAQDEAELAGVMAHEIAHVAARHATRQMTRSQMFNLASIPLIFVGGGVGVAVQQAAGLAMPLSLTKFSRGFETEADYLGVEYLYKSGYDPQAFISFFERIQAQEKQKPGLIAKAFSDHPQTADRMKKTQREIAGILPAREAYLISTSDFEEVKSHLIAMENRHRTVDQDAERPTLRRKSADDNDSEDGEQRPTLKRRGD
jgi:predicted Zn-dependent protease